MIKSKFLRWFGWTVLILLGLALVVVSGGITYQVIATHRDAAAYPPPGKLVDIGGYRLHVHCLGEGNPTVILDAGTGDWSVSWRHIQRVIAEDTHVCAYDRAGLGWSDPGPEPRSSVQIVDELHQLLRTAAIQPPYVLVGHSFGGYNARVYADRYPQEVAGIVLVESAHEDQWERLPQEVKSMLDSAMTRIWIAHRMAQVGLMRFLDVRGQQYSLLEPEVRPGYEAALRSSHTYEAIAGELKAVYESASQVAGTGSLRDLPLVVVTGKKSFNAFFSDPNENFPLERANEVWFELQAELAGLSTNSLHLVSETGTHMLRFEEPEMVAQAIRQVVGAALLRQSSAVDTPLPQAKK